MPPRPAVAIGSAQSAVPSAASYSLPLPSLSPSRLCFHRPLGLCPASRGLGGAREPSLGSRERTGAGSRGWAPARDRPLSPLPRTPRPDRTRGGLPRSSGAAPGPSSARRSLPPSGSQGRVGGQTWLRAGGPEPKRPAGSRLTPRRVRARGSLRNNGPAPGPQTRRANPSPRNARVARTHIHVCACVDLHARTVCRRWDSPRQAPRCGRRGAPIPLPERLGRAGTFWGVLRLPGGHLGIVVKQKGRERRHVLSHRRRPED